MRRHAGRARRHHGHEPSAGGYSDARSARHRPPSGYALVDTGGFRYDYSFFALTGTDLPASVSQGDFVDVSAKFDNTITVPDAPTRTSLLQYFNGAFPDEDISVKDGTLTFFLGGVELLTPATLDSSEFAYVLVSPGTVSAVPEPAIWAMMLLGFGAIGWSMRSRKQGALAA